MVPTCSQKDLGDIGHGVIAEARYLGGKLEGVAYWHPKPEDPSQACEGYISFKPAWEDGWDLISEDPLTVSPSLLCKVCGHHGFIQQGRWIPCP